MSHVPLPVYLRPNELFADMPQRPKRPFFLPPSLYRITDGDTIAVMAPDPERRRGQRKKAFAIRLATVDAYEAPKDYGHNDACRAIGLTPDRDHYGGMARLFMKRLCAGRVLYVEPIKSIDGSVTDKYDRLLANVAISGQPTRGPKSKFHTKGAQSVEPLLVESGLAHVMAGKDLPPSFPLSLYYSKRQLDHEYEARKFKPAPKKTISPESNNATEPQWP